MLCAREDLQKGMGDEERASTDEDGDEKQWKAVSVGNQCKNATQKRKKCLLPILG